MEDPFLSGWPYDPHVPDSAVTGEVVGYMLLMACYVVVAATLFVMIPGYAYTLGFWSAVLSDVSTNFHDAYNWASFVFR